MKLQCLVLVLNIVDGCNKLVDELIADSLKLGLNELHINICYDRYVLPPQVLETTTLTKLSLANCNVRTGGRVLCSDLASLSLRQVTLAGSIMNDILLVCTSIRNLSLVQVPCWPNCPDTINLSTLRNLVHLSFTGDIAFRAKFIDPGGGINAPQYRNLTSMSLLNPDRLDASFFTQFSSLFPSLEDLSLRDVSGYDDVRISSESLKYLELYQGRVLQTVRLVVPNIHKLTFQLRHIPSLSLSTKSKEWESHVDWIGGTVQVSEWRNFLTELSQSKVSLLIHINLANTVWENDVPILPIPPVRENNLNVDLSTWLSSNNLKVDLSVRCMNWNIEELSKWSSRVRRSSLLGDLFKICCPRFVTLDKDCTDLCKGDISTLLKLISDMHTKDKHISIEENEPMSLASLSLRYGLQDVNMELFNENLQEWRTLGKPIDVSCIQDIIKDQETRLHFIWGEPSVA